MSSKRIALRNGRTRDLQSRNIRRLPGRLLSRAIDAYEQGQISIRPLAELAEIDADDLLDELAPPRISPGDGDERLVPLL